MRAKVLYEQEEERVSALVSETGDKVIGRLQAFAGENGIAARVLVDNASDVYGFPAAT